MEHPQNEPDRGKSKYLEKACPSDPLSTTCPSWTGLGMNLEIPSNKGLTDRLTNRLTTRLTEPWHCPN